MAWTLEYLEDLRPMDFDTGDLDPSSNDALPCDHCDDYHPVVMHVHEEDTGVSKVVDPDCVEAACDGWKSGKKALEREMRKLSKAREEQRAREVHSAAEGLAERIMRSRPTPPPEISREWAAARVAEEDARHQLTKMRADIRQRAEMLVMRGLVRQSR